MANKYLQVYLLDYNHIEQDIRGKNTSTALFTLFGIGIFILALILT